MKKQTDIFLEQLHVTAMVPDRMPSGDRNSAVKVLESQHFQSQLRRAVKEAAAQHPTLKGVKFTVTL